MRNALIAASNERGFDMEKAGFRLVISTAAGSGIVRFVVIDRHGPPGHPDRLVGSGTFDTVASAMEAAERMVERLAGPSALLPTAPEWRLH